MADSKPTQNEFRLADPAQFARNMAKVFEHAAQIAGRYADRPDIANREAEPARKADEKSRKRHDNPDIV